MLAIFYRDLQRGYLATIFLMIDDRGRSMICGTNEIVTFLARSLYARDLAQRSIEGTLSKDWVKRTEIFFRDLFRELEL